MKAKSKFETRDEQKKEISDEHRRLGDLCQTISESLARATEQLSLRIDHNELKQILAETDAEDEPLESSQTSAPFEKARLSLVRQRCDSAQDDFNLNSSLSSPFEGRSPGYTHPVKENNEFGLLDFD